MNLKKAIACLLIIIIPVGLYFTYNKMCVSNEYIVVDIEKEYEEYLNKIYNEKTETTFIDMIGEYVTIDFPIIKTRFSNKIKCKVTYPDLKRYFLENKEELLSLSEDQLQSKLIEECANGQKKTIEITFPAKYDSGFLLLDSNCFEYQNALTGGLLELAAERYSELLDEMYAEVKE